MLNIIVCFGVMSDTEKKNREQLILEAAENEFMTKGYDGARTTSIARAAGVTHAMLHYYFRSKEQLFGCILDRNLQPMIQSILSVFGCPKKPLIERLKEGIAVHFDFVASHPLLPHFIINEIISRPERYEILRTKITSSATQLFGDIQSEVNLLASRGEIECFDVRMLFMTIISLNAFPFVTYSFVEPIMGDLMVDREKFLAARKAENIETIMRRIIKM